MTHLNKTGATQSTLHERASTRAEALPKTILVAEDNEFNMKLFRDLLEARVYYVLPTRDGMEALKLVR
jgi:hypothetical protein